MIKVSLVSAPRLRNCLTFTGFGWQVRFGIERDTSGRGCDKDSPSSTARLLCPPGSVADSLGSLPNGGVSISTAAQQVQPTHRPRPAPPAVHVPDAIHYHHTSPPHTHSTPPCASRHLGTHHHPHTLTPAPSHPLQDSVRDGHGARPSSWRPSSSPLQDAHAGCRIF